MKYTLRMVRESNSWTQAQTAKEIDVMQGTAPGTALSTSPETVQTFNELLNSL